jgi:hypothetical protein
VIMARAPAMAVSDSGGRPGAGLGRRLPGTNEESTQDSRRPVFATGHCTAPSCDE